MSLCTQSQCQCFKLALDTSALVVTLDSSMRYNWSTVRKVAMIIFKDHPASILRMKEEFEKSFPGCSFPSELPIGIEVDSFDFRFILASS